MWHCACLRVGSYKVTLYDLSSERIEAGLATINGNLARQVSNGKLSDEDRRATLSRITGSGDVHDFASADLVIEAATEDESVKRKIFAQVCPCLSRTRCLLPIPLRFPLRALLRQQTARSASWVFTS